MFSDEYTAMVAASKGKLSLLNNKPFAYFISSILAGMFIGIGILLCFTSGGLLQGAPYTKIVMGMTFAVALSLVVIAGAELFTGNNMVMMAGVLRKEVTVGGMLKLWVICWIGNWIGSFLLALMFTGTGLATGDVGQFMADAAATKMTIPFGPLLLRAIFCNFLVCLAVWCGFKCKSDSGKLIMVFWCIFAFVTTGMEHSVANMTLLGIGVLNPMNPDISVMGYFYNILTVSLGNIIAGTVFVAWPYHLISKKKEKKAEEKGEEKAAEATE